VHEIELKFQVPPAALAGVRAALERGAVRRQRLAAVYVDTAGRDLAAAAWALRLRKEGARWVQTLKGRGDGLLARLEHEVVLPRPAAGGVPGVDPARHAGTPAGEALAALLAKVAAERGEEAARLRPMYRTEVRRTSRTLRHAGARIELALDEGRLVAGGHEGIEDAAGERRLALRELEFELVAGPPAALVALASRWVARHGLWWDLRTKSERGFRLRAEVDGSTGPPPPVAAAAAAKLAPLPRVGAAPGAAFAAIVRHALVHALANLAPIAEGTAAPEHLHQLRVALRRLRTALRVLAPWCADPAAAAALEARWRSAFATLGGARDRDVIDAEWTPALAPALAASGLPPHWPVAAPAVADVAAAVRAPALHGLLLETLALALAPPPGGPRGAGDERGEGGEGAEGTANASVPTPPAPPTAAEVVARLWKRIARDIEGFAGADVESRHRTRRRLKRLRYTLEFTAGAFRAKPLRAFTKALKAAAEGLGRANDLETALADLGPPAEGDPAARWFARGWLIATRPAVLAEAQRALAALAEAPRPWRRVRRSAQRGSGASPRASSSADSTPGRRRSAPTSAAKPER
jgi:inorganic triphosphatase YgiF